MVIVGLCKTNNSSTNKLTQNALVGKMQNKNIYV